MQLDLQGSPCRRPAVVPRYGAAPHPRHLLGSQTFSAVPGHHLHAIVEPCQEFPCRRKWLESMLAQLPGVDPNDPAIQAALASINQGGEKKDDDAPAPAPAP